MLKIIYNRLSKIYSVEFLQSQHEEFERFRKELNKDTFVKKISKVVASDDELKLIMETMEGLPFQKVSEQSVWREPFSRFILDNLDLGYRVKIREREYQKQLQQEERNEEKLQHFPKLLDLSQRLEALGPGALESHIFEGSLEDYAEEANRYGNKHSALYSSLGLLTEETPEGGKKFEFFTDFPFWSGGMGESINHVVYHFSVKTGKQNTPGYVILTEKNFKE